MCIHFISFFFWIYHNYNYLKFIQPSFSVKLHNGWVVLCVSAFFSNTWIIFFFSLISTPPLGTNKYFFLFYRIFHFYSLFLIALFPFSKYKKCATAYGRREYNEHVTPIKRTNLTLNPFYGYVQSQSYLLYMLVIKFISITFDYASLLFAKHFSTIECHNKQKN